MDQRTPPSGTQRNSPLEVTPLPDVKPRKSWVPFIMGSILFGSVVMAVVFGIWGFVRLIDNINPPGGFGMSSRGEDWQATQEKQAVFREHFRLPVAVLEDASAPQVEKLLAKYVAAAKFNDQGSLARLVDVE